MAKSRARTERRSTLVEQGLADLQQAVGRIEALTPAYPACAPRSSPGWIKPVS